MSQSASPQALAALCAYRKAEREAYNAADLSMVENFAEDIILTLNGAPTIKGREAVREFFRVLWENNKARFVEVVDEDIAEFGAYLSVCGRFTLEITPRPGGQAVIDRGRYSGVFVKDARGRYLLWREACMDAGPA